jgi:hypothetical protein
MLSSKGFTRQKREKYLSGGCEQDVESARAAMQ